MHICRGGLFLLKSFEREKRHKTQKNTVKYLNRGTNYISCFVADSNFEVILWKMTQID